MGWLEPGTQEDRRTPEAGGLPEPRVGGQCRPRQAERSGIGSIGLV